MNSELEAWTHCIVLVWEGKRGPIHRHTFKVEGFDKIC